VTRSGIRLVKPAATDRANRESEERVFLSQKLGSTSVESGGGSGETESSTDFVDREALGKLADHEEEESHIEKGEDGDQGDVNLEGCQEKEEADDKPCSQKDSESVGKLARSICVGSRNTEVGMKNGSVGQPETSKRRESSRAERITSSKLPHSSEDLSKTTDETSHTDNGVRNNNTAGLDVVHGEDEGGAREREETKRTRVTDDPQLRGSVVDISVGRERRSGVSSGTGIVNGTLLVCDVAHDSG